MVTNTMFSAVIAERDALQTALATEREIWVNAASEQGRVIAELRALGVEVKAAFWAWVESNPAKASEFIPAMERLDAAVKALTP